MSDNGIKRIGRTGKDLPFARAVQAGGFLYISGQVALDENGVVVDGGIAVQTEKTIENVKSILAEAGYDLSHVVKVNAWLDDPRDFRGFNQVFERYFGAALPARATVVSPLVVDAKVEIEAVAYKPQS